MSRTIRKPITSIADLSVGDVLVWKDGSDGRFTVTATGRRAVLLESSTNSTETFDREDALIEQYDVERPETLPPGLEHQSGQYAIYSMYVFADWADDTARVNVGYDGPRPVVIVSSLSNGSIHFDRETLEYLLTEVKALEG